jgi:universal stress protein A
MDIKKIACCVDFSENARAAFKASVEMSEKFESKLYLIHVIPLLIHPYVADTEWIMPDMPQEAMLSSVRERMEQEYVSKIKGTLLQEVIILEGHVSSSIIEVLEEKEIDLVITGAYGVSGMGLVIFGSVAKRIAHKAPCSVMIVRESQQE